MDIRRALPADLPAVAAPLAGVMREVRRKHGPWIDVVRLQKVLG